MIGFSVLGLEGADPAGGDQGSVEQEIAFKGAVELHGVIGFCTGRQEEIIDAVFFVPLDPRVAVLDAVRGMRVQAVWLISDDARVGVRRLGGFGRGLGRIGGLGGSRQITGVCPVGDHRGVQSVFIIRGGDRDGFVPELFCIAAPEAHDRSARVGGGDGVRVHLSLFVMGHAGHGVVAAFVGVGDHDGAVHILFARRVGEIRVQDRPVIRPVVGVDDLQIEYVALFKAFVGHRGERYGRYGGDDQNEYEDEGGQSFHVNFSFSVRFG